MIGAAPGVSLTPRITKREKRKEFRPSNQLCSSGCFSLSASFLLNHAHDLDTTHQYSHPDDRVAFDARYLCQDQIIERRSQIAALG
jgi:hypothetical protein